MTVESIPEDILQRRNGITTKFYVTRILTEGIPVSDRIVARAEGALGDKIAYRGARDIFDLIILVPVFVQFLSQRNLLLRVRDSG